MIAKNLFKILVKKHCFTFPPDLFSRAWLINNCQALSGYWLTSGSQLKKERRCVCNEWIQLFFNFLDLFLKTINWLLAKQIKILARLYFLWTFEGKPTAQAKNCCSKKLCWNSQVSSKTCGVYKCEQQLNKYFFLSPDSFELFLPARDAVICLISYTYAPNSVFLHTSSIAAQNLFVAPSNIFD